jgi:hypothetical protein
MNRDALRVIDDFMSPAQCGEILTSIRSYRAQNEPPLIDRVERSRSLRYRVIDGNAVAQGLTELEVLYRQIGQLISEWSGQTLVPIEDRVAGININITPPGGEYRWHYDRNAVTAILYLNQVQGGATEIYANHRILLPPSLQMLQHGVDAIARGRLALTLVGKKTAVTPQAGRLVVMRGDRCLHSVCAVEGTEERINLCLAYDRLGARHQQHRALDDYLYSDHVVGGPDPNYLS